MSGWFSALLATALAATLLFLGLPVVALFVDASPSDLLSSLGDSSSLDALRLSLETSAVALALILAIGTPAAWMLATREFRLKAALVTLVELPLVLPPAAAGIALLAALGPHGIAGGLLDDAGITLVLTTAGVVVAMAFVASPFYIRQAQASFEALDPRMLEAARTLGASEARSFRRIALPLARNGLLAGAALAWGRALGEFGATLMFAGSLRGVTQTAPLALYERFATDFPAAIALAAVLVAVSAAVLITVKLATRSEPLAARRA
ncbi:MAG: molybdate transport system permease protein [Thermoleophilaceae bacterium]|jgi:molybdate transport system permease protein|nr:molybdate transport system permease protein [Thermoleophilaceae bacterium]